MTDTIRFLKDCKNIPINKCWKCGDGCCTYAEIEYDDRKAGDEEEIGFFNGEVNDIEFFDLCMEHVLIENVDFEYI